MAPPVLGVLLGLALYAGSPAPAEATGVRIIGGDRHRLHHDPHHPPGRHHHRTHHGHGVHPRSETLIVPHAAVLLPAPPSRRWVPGYTTYQWVPQGVTSEVWVPGHWSPEGSWIPGHYERRTVHTGYYRPVRVEGYWVPY